MTEKTSENLPSQDAATDTAAMPVRLVRGIASPDEFSALVAVVAVLATASGDPDPTDRASSESGRYSRSQWSSPARMVRGSHAHGPRGWRASAAPR